jgi:hypothetical protein
MKRQIKIDEYKNFKIGMKVIILDYPDAWSSGLNENCPSRISYPYHCKIKEMIYHEDSYGNIFCSMTDGEYGFEIDSLIKKNFIILEKSEERKLKLKKIKDEK